MLFLSCSQEQFREACSECALREGTDDATPCSTCKATPRAKRSSTRTCSATSPTRAPIIPSTSLPSDECPRGCDTEDEDWEPSVPRQKKGTFTLTFDNDNFVELFAPFADRVQLSGRQLTEMLGQIVVNGGGDASDVILSHSTVVKRMNKARNDANLQARFQTYDKPSTMHFDGVKLLLGGHQGGGKVEHLAITLTGRSGEKVIGVIVAPNGTGM